MIRELDIYGRVRMEEGETNFVPFLFQGQYYDVETKLAYNRFRYYAPEWGMYISQDPIRLEAGLTNPYAYVHDTNGWIDPLGLAKTLTLRAAFRRAKQQLRIPKNVNTPIATKVFDSSSENRTVWAFTGEHKGKYIILHADDKFGRPPHLHTATDLDRYSSPLIKGRYNQHAGHIPEEREVLLRGSKKHQDKDMDKFKMLKIRNARGFILKNFNYLSIVDVYDPGTPEYKELFQIIESTQNVLYATPVSQDESKVLRAYFDIISSRIMKSSQFIYIAAAHCEIYFWMKVKKTSLERNLNIVRDVGIRCFISDQDDAFHIHTGEYMIELLSNVPR